MAMAVPLVATPAESRVDARTAAAVRPSDATLWDRSRLLWLGQAVALLALSLAIWAGCLRLFQLHNDFPSFDHPDERTKAAQLRDNDRNYNHPQLMLEAALQVLPPLMPDADADGIVKQARTVSAGFAAGTAVLMAWAGFAAAGWAGFLTLGLATALCPALFSHAHFFKEDASLMFGISVVLCAGAWALRGRGSGPQLWAILGLGVGAGLAASGKYCGAVMLLPAVGVAVAAARRHLGLLAAAPLIVCVFAAAVWLTVNYRVFHDFDSFVKSFESEKNHSESSHTSLTMDRPNAYFADLVWTEAMPHVKAFAVLAVPLMVWQAWRRRAWGFGLWLILTGAIYLIMLSYSVIPFYRYALPVTVMLYALAALAVAWLATLPARPAYRAAALAAGLLIIGLTQGLRVADYTRQFADDSRDAVAEWTQANLPPGTPVATDHYVGLRYRQHFGLVGPNPGVAVVETFHATMAGQYTPEGLRQRGVQYVITAGSTSERFLSPHARAVPAAERAIQNTQAFYRDIQRYPVVWSRVARHPMWAFANPDIVVYKLDALPAERRDG